MSRHQRKPTKYTEMDLEVKYQTEKAILVTDGVKEGWLPKSTIDNVDDIEEGVCSNLLVADWILEKDGWV